MTTPTHEQEYITDLESLSALADYFNAAIDGSEDKSKLNRLWDVQMQIILSRPHTQPPTTCPQNAIWDHCPHATSIRKAERDKVLSFLDELISDRVSDARKREIVESLRTPKEHNQ